MMRGLGAIGLATAIAPACAAEPAVKGPQSVGDWADSGRRFVQTVQALRPNFGRATVIDKTGSFT